MSQVFRKVLSPVITPFDKGLAPDAGRFVRQCRWLDAQGVGLVPFGTTSEANSLSSAERIALLERLVGDGLDPAKMLPGTGCCSLTESVELTRHAVGLGCAGVLMLPPFYYKGVGDDGLFRYFAEVIERVADDRLRLYLYHIPPMTQVGFSVALIRRLIDAYPKVIAGIKDSSGDWNNTLAVLDGTRGTGFQVFAGSEAFLLRNLRAGGVGCITATANVNPAPIRAVLDGWQGPEADALQARIDAVRAAIQKYPMIPALKRILAASRSEPEWAKVRPPLVELADAAFAELESALMALGFSVAPEAR